MDYTDLLILASLQLKCDFVFNPLDIDNERRFMQNIEVFISNELETDNKRDVLIYIEGKIKPLLNLFHSNNDMFRYENTKNVLSWIKSQIYNEEEKPEIVEGLLDHLDNKEEIKEVKEANVIDEALDFLNNRKEEKPSIEEWALYLYNSGKIEVHFIREWAMYHYYLQEAKIIKHFNNHQINKTRAFQEIADELGINAKNFEKHYSEVSNHIDERTKFDSRHLGYFEKVIEMLKDYPKAKEFAVKEFLIAKEKKKNNHKKS